MNNGISLSTLNDEEIIIAYRKSSLTNGERFDLYIELAQRGLLDPKKEYVLFKGHPDVSTQTSENGLVLYLAVFGMIYCGLFQLVPWFMLFLLLMLDSQLKIVVRKNIQIKPQGIFTFFTLFRCIHIYTRSVSFRSNATYIAIEPAPALFSYSGTFCAYNLSNNSEKICIKLAPKTLVFLADGLINFMGFTGYNYFLHPIPSIIYKKAGSLPIDSSTPTLPVFCARFKLPERLGVTSEMLKYNLNWLRLACFIQGKVVPSEFRITNNHLKGDEYILWVVDNGYKMPLLKREIVFTSYQILLFKWSIKNPLKSNYSEVRLIEVDGMPGHLFIEINGDKFFYFNGVPYPFEDLIQYFQHLSTP